MITIYHVEWWKKPNHNDDCIHSSVISCGYYLHYEDATKIAAQYPIGESTISSIPVIERL